MISIAVSLKAINGLFCLEPGEASSGAEAEPSLSPVCFISGVPSLSYSFLFMIFPIYLSNLYEGKEKIDLLVLTRLNWTLLDCSARPLNNRQLPV